MQKLSTTDDLLNDRSLFTEIEAEEIRKHANEEAERILHGGKRENAGKKPQIAGASRNINVKVSSDTKKALQYAYSIGVVINLDDIKLLQFIKENGLTLSELKQSYS